MVRVRPLVVGLVGMDGRCGMHVMPSGSENANAVCMRGVACGMRGMEGAGCGGAECVRTRRGGSG